MKTNCSHPVVYNIKGHPTCISCGAVLDENQEPEKEQEQEPEKEAEETPVEAQEDEKKDKPSRKRKAASNDK